MPKLGHYPPSTPHTFDPSFLTPVRSAGIRNDTGLRNGVVRDTAIRCIYFFACMLENPSESAPSRPRRHWFSAS